MSVSLKPYSNPLSRWPPPILTLRRTARPRALANRPGLPDFLFSTAHETGVPAGAKKMRRSALVPGTFRLFYSGSILEGDGGWYI
jgi:hypothetical protein